MFGSLLLILVNIFKIFVSFDFYSYLCNPNIKRKDYG